MLVATDEAIIGTDFPDIKHVINFDILSGLKTTCINGGAGSCGYTVVAATFIKNVPGSALMDQYNRLVGFKSTLPPELAAPDDPHERLQRTYDGW